MQTLKIKYNVYIEDTTTIRAYRKQYAACLHVAFNLRKNGESEKSTEKNISLLNNTPLIKSFLHRCAVKNATQLLQSIDNDKKLIFGGRKAFFDRMNNKISKEEYRDKRLGKLLIIGEANQHANRFIRISEDCNSFIFTPERGTKIILQIDGSYKRYKTLLQRLYILQEDKRTPITYSLDNEYIYVTFDEFVMASNQYEVNPIKNRIFSIDINPNYIGWSVVDWKNSGTFNVVNSGVISIKLLNDKDFALKDKGIPSTDKLRKYINNKRVHEVYEICKLLVKKAQYYKCEVFSIEELTIQSKDRERGTHFNRLVNNLWNRNRLLSNIEKRCNLCGLRLIKVKAAYSSFIGNFLFRDLMLPDMVLSSIEIGRRGYEFLRQYIRKDKEKEKNILQPNIIDFADRFAKSAEEFGISGGVNDLVCAYKEIKKTKSRYRLSLDLFVDLRFFRYNSERSMVMQTCIKPSIFS